jgi:hypothetical protein
MSMKNQQDPAPPLIGQSMDHALRINQFKRNRLLANSSRHESNPHLK